MCAVICQLPLIPIPLRFPTFATIMGRQSHRDYWNFSHSQRVFAYCESFVIIIIITQTAAIALEPLTTHPDEWAEPSILFKTTDQRNSTDSRSRLSMITQCAYRGMAWYIVSYYTLLGGCYVYSSTINQLPTQEGVKVRISTVVRANIKGMV